MNALLKKMRADAEVCNARLRKEVINNNAVCYEERKKTFKADSWNGKVSRLRVNSAHGKPPSISGLANAACPRFYAARG